MSCCSTIQNILTAGIKQPNPVAWFRDAVSGLIKCAKQQQIYTDEDIAKNRASCGNCEHSTKTESLLTVQSQCMAPDPTRGNAPCGCFIICKTMVDKCPLNKWDTKEAEITIRGKPIVFSNENNVPL